MCLSDVIGGEEEEKIQFKLTEIVGINRFR